MQAICHVLNLSVLGLPSMIEGYNGKPVLIKKTGTTYQVTLSHWFVPSSYNLCNLSSRLKSISKWMSTLTDSVSSHDRCLS